MKKIIGCLVLFAIVLTACGGVTIVKPTEASAPAVPTATLQSAAISTSTPVPPIAPLPKWNLPDPPEAKMLPTELSKEIKYIEPPIDCSKENNPQFTCSTKKGQATEGDFVLKANQAIVMTGDSIEISQEGKTLAKRPSLDTVHDLWIVVNNSDSEIKLHMKAPYGSFRGYFQVDGKWNIQEVTHLRNLHLYLFLLPDQTYDRFTPTPVPNCESRFGCDKVNVRVLVYDNLECNIAGYGLYLEGQPFWQNLLQFLGM